MATAGQTGDEQREWIRKEGDRLYEQYGKPLEAEHWGEFVAINADGRTMLSSDVRELTREACEAFGPGNFIFKVGPRVTGRWI